MSQKTVACIRKIFFSNVVQKIYSKDNVPRAIRFAIEDMLKDISQDIEYGRYKPEIHKQNINGFFEKLQSNALQISKRTSWFFQHKTYEDETKFPKPDYALKHLLQNFKTQCREALKAANLDMVNNNTTKKL